MGLARILTLTVAIRFAWLSWTTRSLSPRDLSIWPAGHVGNSTCSGLTTRSFTMPPRFNSTFGDASTVQDLKNLGAYIFPPTQAPIKGQLVSRKGDGDCGYWRLPKPNASAFFNGYLGTQTT